MKEMEGATLIKISAIYKCIEECHFDANYYLEEHIPMAERVLQECGLVKIEADVFESIEDILPVKYFAMTHAFFNDDTSLASVLSHEGMSKIVDDVSNYTDVIPSLQTSRVKQ